MEKTKRDPYDMKAPGRDHEADAIEKTALSFGKLGPVGVAVKDREEPDHHRGGRERRPGFREHEDSEDEGGDRDSDLDPGKRHTQEPERPAECHDHGKRYRENPERGRPQLGAPDAHRDHREHVIEPGDGVDETGDESSRLPRLDVRCGEEERRHVYAVPSFFRPSSCLRSSSPFQGEMASVTSPWHWA